MDDSTREFSGSPVWQGRNEEVSYPITTTNWGSSPTDVEAKLYSVSGGAYTDVTSTNLSGSPSVNGDVITTPVVKDLVAGTEYRMEVKFTSGSQIYEGFMRIYGQR